MSLAELNPVEPAIETVGPGGLHRQARCGDAWIGCWLNAMNA